MSSQSEIKNSVLLPESILHKRVIAYLLILIYLALVLFPGVLVLVQSGISEIVYTLAKFAGMTAISIFALQVILGSRLRFLDRPFGLNVVLSVHAKMAIFGFFLAILHPVLLIILSGDFSLLSLDNSSGINLGKLGLMLLFLAILLAVFFKNLKIDYNRWHTMHKGMIIVLVLLFIHAFAVGSNLEEGIARTVLAVYFAVAILTFLYRNIAVPLFRRKKFSIDKITRETQDVWSFDFKPKSGSFNGYYPGQFMFLKLVRPGRSSQEHPFTICSSPGDSDIIRASIKQSGDFTNTIHNTTLEDTALIDEPFGRFTLTLYPAEKYIFIAGGIGITPFMSMIRYLNQTEDNREVVLLYGNKTAKDIAFREELDSLPENFRVIHVLSQAEKNWSGETGYINSEIIDRFCAKILKDSHIFICGPPPMMKSVRRALIKMGIPRTRIHWEKFAFTH